MECYEAIDVMDEALAGRLPAALAPGFDEHMGECPLCATYFAQLQVTRQALHAAREDDATCPRRADLLAEFRRARGERDDE